MAEHSNIIMEHAESPSNVGCLKDADAEATTGAVGRPPFMTMSFRIRAGIVDAVRYRTFGCAPAIAAGSVLTEMITGRSLSQCMEITEQQLRDKLGCGSLDGGSKNGGSKGKDYTQLALSTMRKALTEYQNEQTS